MRGSKPGERRGGRKKGTPNRATAAKAASVEASGQTPLDYFLQVVRDPMQHGPARLEAAKAAAPYIHPRLASLEQRVQVQAPMTYRETLELLTQEEREQLREVLQIALQRQAQNPSQP